MLDVSDLNIGDRVRFKLLSPHDTMYHTGTLISLCNYNSARMWGDIDTTYRNLMSSGKNPKELTTETYYVFEYTQEGVTQHMVVGKSWIDSSTLERVDVDTSHLIRVYEIDQSVAKEIVETIKSYGYTAELVVD